MTFRRRFLQFSLRTMLWATFLGIVAGQTYRIAVHDRELRLLGAQYDAEIEKVLTQNRDRPPRCALLILGQLSRKLEQSDFRQLSAWERTRLGSRIEAERFRHFSRGDQQAAMRSKPTQFTRVDDMLTRP